MTSQEFKKLLDKFSRGECSTSEEQFILEWYKKIGSDQDHELSEDYRIVVEAKIWSRLQQRLGKPDQGPAIRWTKIAAAILLFAVAGASAYVVFNRFSFNQTANTKSPGIFAAPGGIMVNFTNTTTLPQVIKLVDGTEVSVQPNSEIEYPPTFGANREVFLKGEAFFNVKRDTAHPFLVYSNEVVTRVLGTSFNVKAYDGSRDITVSVKTGRVSVSKNSLTMSSREMRDVIILAPNQRAVYDRSKNEVTRHLVERPEIVRPLSEELVMKYDGVQVVKIFDALEEMYGVDINFDDEVLQNCTLTTTLKEEGLFERIKVICEAIGAHYEVQETSILITSQGCNN